MPSFIFKLKSMQSNDKHTPEDDNASLSSTFSVGELKKRNAPFRGILVDVSRSSGTVRKSVRFNDEPNVCSEAAVSKRYASICWYSKDKYHDFKDEYFHSIRRLVRSPKACDCNFRRLVSSIHTSCCSKTNGVCSNKISPNATPQRHYPLSAVEQAFLGWSECHRRPCFTRQRSVAQKCWSSSAMLKEMTTSMLLRRSLLSSVLQVLSSLKAWAKRFTCHNYNYQQDRRFYKPAPFFDSFCLPSTFHSLYRFFDYPTPCNYYTCSLLRD